MSQPFIVVGHKINHCVAVLSSIATSVPVAAKLRASMTSLASSAVSPHSCPTTRRPRSTVSLPPSAAKRCVGQIRVKWFGSRVGTADESRDQTGPPAKIQVRE